MMLKGGGPKLREDSQICVWSAEQSVEVVEAKFSYLESRNESQFDASWVQPAVEIPACQSPAGVSKRFDFLLVFLAMLMVPYLDGRKLSA
jgi:hypothetical protein